MILATLIVDSREQMPYGFAGCCSKHVAFSITHSGLSEGDYAAYIGEPPDVSEWCVVERKSHADLLGTLTRGRQQFEAELERLRPYGFKALVIESDLPTIVQGTSRPGSKVNTKSIIASLIAFAQRFKVHVYFASNRRLAEVYTYRILERWVRDRAEVAVPA